jgi:hypothetical protein
MISTIETLEKGLSDQLFDLTGKIRSAEAELMSLKEGYLKVQGAIEILDVLKKQISEEKDGKLSDEEAVAAVAEVI